MLFSNQDSVYSKIHAYVETFYIFYVVCGSSLPILCVVLMSYNMFAIYTLAGKWFYLSFSKDNKLSKIIDSSYFRLLLNHIVMVEITLIFIDNCKHLDKQPSGLVEYFRIVSVFHGLLITLKNNSWSQLI